MVEAIKKTLLEINVLFVDLFAKIIPRVIHQDFLFVTDLYAIKYPQQMSFFFIDLRGEDSTTKESLCFFMKKFVGIFYAEFRGNLYIFIFI